MIKKILIVLLLIFSLVTQVKAGKFKEGSIIGDAEIEHYLEEWLEPFLKIGNLNAKPKVYLMVNKDFNAFCAEGYVFVFFTGFFKKITSVEQLLGVMAHEAGHAVKHHGLQSRFANSESSIPFLLGTLLGGVAGLASGDPTLAIAGISLGANISERQQLKYSRNHENEADTFAVHALKTLQYSLKGLEEVFKIFNTMAMGVSISPYIITHPMPTERLQKLKLMIEKQNYQPILPPQAEEKFMKIKGKIDGYFLSPNEVKRKYGPNHKFPLIQAQYALSIAEYRLGNVKKSLTIIETLREKEPHNPFYLELMGQICFESGQLKQSIKYYKQAVEILNSYYILVTYAHALLEDNQIKQAEEITNKAAGLKNDDYGLWILRATIAEKKGEMQTRDWCMAEASLIEKNPAKTKRYAEKAMKGSDKKIVNKVKDILELLKNKSSVAD